MQKKQVDIRKSCISEMLHLLDRQMIPDMLTVFGKLR